MGKQSFMLHMEAKSKYAKASIFLSVQDLLGFFILDSQFQIKKNKSLQLNPEQKKRCFWRKLDSSESQRFVQVDVSLLVQQRAAYQKAD